MKVDMKPLSKETCREIADWGDKVIRDAVKNNQLVPQSAYEAPEVLQSRINYTVGQIVNFALTKAHAEWSEDEEIESCAYCCEYEHGMRAMGDTECTCPTHCGAMVCPRDNASKADSCLHARYGDTTNCAVIDCPNYAGKHVRTVRGPKNGGQATREQIQRDNAVRWQPNHTNDVLGT